MKTIVTINNSIRAKILINVVFLVVSVTMRGHWYGGLTRIEYQFFQRGTIAGYILEKCLWTIIS